MSNHIPIFAIDGKGEKHRMGIDKDMLGQLAELMRKEGPTQLHTVDKSVEVHAVILMAKGSKTNMVMFPLEGDK